jgi:competence protein ComEC
VTATQARVERPSPGPAAAVVRAQSTIDLRLALPAAAAWVAIVLLLPVPEFRVPVAGAGWFVALGSLAVSFRTGRRGLVPVAVAAACVSLVVGSAAAREPARHPAPLVVASESGRPLTARAVVTSAALDGRFEAELIAVAGADGDPATSIVHVPVLVFDGVPDEPMGIGAIVTVTGTVVATDPGDSTAYLVFATTPTEVQAPAPWQLSWADELRSTFAERVAGLGGDGARLLPGLAIGDTSAVDESLDQAMKASSLSHLTAVSGANCAIIVGLIMLAGGTIGLGRTWRIAASLAVLVAFVILVTPEPSVLRAALMAALVLVALASGRPAAGIPVLALAVIALLTHDPWLGRSYGFALSVLATGGLLVLAAPLTRLFARLLPLWLGAAVAVPVAAQLACQPVLLLLDPSIPLFGIVANILAAPAAPLATVVGLAACVIAPVVPAVAAALAQVAWFPAAWIGAVARFFADVPGARIPWPGGVPGALALAALTILVLVATLAAVGAAWRRRMLVAAAAILAVIVGIGGGSLIASVVGRPADWQIAACPIGQGDAMLVRSAGRVALIDTGPEPVLLADCLTTLRIDRLDLLILSHFDLDHVGGTDAVLGRADRAIIGPTANREDERLVAALAEAGTEVLEVSRGNSGVLGDLRWSVLWPPGRLGDIEPGNDASVVVRFDPVGACTGGCLGSLFLGDLGEEAQERMARLNRPLARADVVKVSHHGSADQSAPLYTAVNARIALVGVGADNGYGHPAEPTLDLLAATHAAVARTDEDGLVLVAPGQSPGQLRLWRQHGDVGGGD